MTTQRTKIALFALIPVFLAPLAIVLSHKDEPQLLIGLSSDFWSGTLIGASIVTLIAAGYFLARLPKQN